MVPKWIRSLEREDLLESGIATHSPDKCSCLENPNGYRSLAGLQSMGLQRVRHDRVTNTFTFSLLFLSGDSPWSQEPGGLQSMGSQRVRHDRVTNTFIFSLLRVMCGSPFTLEHISLSWDSPGHQLRMSTTSAPLTGLQHTHPILIQDLFHASTQPISIFLCFL